MKKNIFKILIAIVFILGASSVYTAFAANNPPTVHFTASSTSITYGATTDLFWDTKDVFEHPTATSCTGTSNNGWSTNLIEGDEPTSNLTSTTTYTLTCDNANGNTTKSVTINVAGIGNNITIYPTNTSQPTAKTLNLFSPLHSTYSAINTTFISPTNTNDAQFTFDLATNGIPGAVMNVDVYVTPVTGCPLPCTNRIKVGSIRSPELPNNNWPYLDNWSNGILVNTISPLALIAGAQYYLDVNFNFEIAYGGTINGSYGMNLRNFKISPYVFDGIYINRHTYNTDNPPNRIFDAFETTFTPTIDTSDIYFSVDVGTHNLHDSTVGVQIDISTDSGHTLNTGSYNSGRIPIGTISWCDRQDACWSNGAIFYTQYNNYKPYPLVAGTTYYIRVTYTERDDGSTRGPSAVKIRNFAIYKHTALPPRQGSGNKGPLMGTGLSVNTGTAAPISQTSATLHGSVGESFTYPPGCTSFTGFSFTTGLPCSRGRGTNSNPGALTAYFRYSKKIIAPVFCNDIYGANMIATGDITKDDSPLPPLSPRQPRDLGVALPQSFSKEIKNLTPDTTYYYCAIVSNKDNIFYGENNTVKSFHTSPLATTITTNPATRISSTTAQLNGSYSSVKNVKTYFKYKVDTVATANLSNDSSTSDSWQEVGIKDHLIKSYSNLSGDINVYVSGLKSNTRYIFMAVAEDDLGTITATPLSFTTNKGSGTGGGTGDDTTKCTLPYVLDNFTKTCVNSGRCNSPLIYDSNTKTCIEDLRPKVTVSATPSSITAGESSTIKWEAKNSNHCDTGGVAQLENQNDTGTDNKILSGSFPTGVLTATKSFTVTCTGDHGVASGNARVLVTTPRICPNGANNYPKCDTFDGKCPNDATNYPICDNGGGGIGDNLFPSVTVTATPATVLPGKTSRISWTATNVKTCDTGKVGKLENLNDSQVDTKNILSGYFDTDPLTKSKSFSVVCTGVNGRASGNAYVFVDKGGGEIGDNLFPSVTVTATPATVGLNRISVIHWESTNTTVCDTGGHGTETSGNFSTDKLTKSKSFSVVCTGVNGRASGNAYVFVDKNINTCPNGATNYPACDDNINICSNGAINYPKCTIGTGGGCLNGAINPPACDVNWTEDNTLPTVTVTATPSSITSGKTSTINWTSKNTTSCSIGINTAKGGTTGSFSTGTLTKSKSYSVTCVGPEGTASGSVFVLVTTGGGGGEDNLLPTVDVQATPPSIKTGGLSTISWTSKNTTSCNTGIPSGDTTDKANKIGTTGSTSGSFSTGALTNSQSYSVTCLGGKGTASDSTFVLVKNDGGGIVCKLPNVLDKKTNTCVNPTFCTPPKSYDSNTNSCVTPKVCTPPTVLNPATNTCVTPVVCTLPKVLDRIMNVCITPPTLKFCTEHPTDPSCLPGPGIWDGTGWDGGYWVGGVWNDGTWTGGGWVDGNWVGGVWTGKDPSGNGMGIWSGGTWSNGAWIGGTWKKTLTLGQTATPPNIALVHYGEGVETVFMRQIMANSDFAKTYGYKEGNDMQLFAWDLADQFAKTFGYVDGHGKEIRVSLPDVAAYELQLIENKLTVYEYYKNKIVDIRNTTTVFKNASGYEYYFTKN